MITNNSIFHELTVVLGTGRVCGEEFNFCCPYCLKRKGTKDTKFHFYVNARKNRYYCHRCNASGSLDFILGKRTIKPSVSNWQSKLNFQRSEEAEKTVVMPEDYLDVVKGTVAYSYLKTRGISDEDIAYYNIGFGYKNVFGMSKEESRKYVGSGRIIFPDFDDSGNIIYWVARTYVGHKIRYKNPPNSDSGDKIYNFHRAKYHDEVIITEGVISAILAGRNAVATYGKDVTSKQISMLASRGFKSYIVALDGDTRVSKNKSGKLPDLLKVSESLKRRGCNVKVVELPYSEDPASVENFNEYVESASDYDFDKKVDSLLSSNLILKVKLETKEKTL